MKAKISKWGNSLAIRLPRAVVESLHAREGEAVDLAIEGERVVIRSARRRYTLDELVAGITPDNQPEYIDSPPVGEELL